MAGPSSKLGSEPREVVLSEQQAMKKWREDSAKRDGLKYYINVIINV
jgi:hypothetical protein